MRMLFLHTVCTWVFRLHLGTLSKTSFVDYNVHMGTYGAATQHRVGDLKLISIIITLICTSNIRQVFINAN